MRTSFFLLATLTTLGSVAAQTIPLPPYVSTFSSATLTRGFWFQAPTDFIITGLQVPDEQFEGIQHVAIVDLGNNPPPVWSTTAVLPTLFHSDNQPSSIVIPCAVPVSNGQYIGILGGCGSTTMRSSYTSAGAPNSPFNTTIFGQPITLTRFGTQVSIANNPGPYAVWTELTAAVSRVEVHVALPQGFAQAQSYGTGCYDSYASFYETFPNGSFDLSNTSMMLAFTGDGYAVVPGGSSWHTPTSPNLALANNAISTARNLGFTMPFPGGATSNIYISSNGIVWGAPSTINGCCAGNVQQFLNNQPCWAPNWGDLSPANGGSIHFDTDPVAQAAYVTFLNVPETGSSTNLNTFQIAFFASGIVEYRYQNCMQANRLVLTGWSPGGGARNPGSVDLSASLPIVTAPDRFGLAHNASTRPVLGTSVNLVTSQVPTAGLLGTTLFGLTEFTAGVDLSAVGMPGCMQYTSIEGSAVWFPTGGSGSTTFALPNNPTLAGVQIKTQGVALVPGVNPVGAQSSNGLRLILDIN